MLEHFWKQELMNQVPHNTWNLIQLLAIIQNIHFLKKHTRSLDTQWLRQIVKQILGALNMIPHSVHSPTNQQAMCSYMPISLMSILCCGIMLLYTVKSSGLQLSFPIPSLSLLSSWSARLPLATIDRNYLKRWMLFLTSSNLLARSATLV